MPCRRAATALSHDRHPQFGVPYCNGLENIISHSNKSSPICVLQFFASLVFYKIGFLIFSSFTLQWMWIVNHAQGLTPARLCIVVTALQIVMAFQTEEDGRNMETQEKVISSAGFTSVPPAAGCFGGFIQRMKSGMTITQCVWSTWLF